MRVIPFGDRIMVRRKTVGAKVGSILLPESTSERPTDLADVLYVPDLTFADKEIIENAGLIIQSLSDKAAAGDADAVNTMLRLNAFIKEKSIKVGDVVFISKYVGTDFHEKGSNEDLTLVRTDDIIGLVVQDA